MLLVYRDRGLAVDGIRDYTQQLEEALAGRDGLSVATQHRVAPGFTRHGPRSARIVLQYSPFCYARWGFAPWLPAEMLTLRRRRHRPKVAVMVHEPFVPLTGVRWAIMGLWQRLQLWALSLAADVVFVSIENWSRRLGRWRPRRPVHHLPVGSNLPDMRAARERERAALGVDPGTLVVAALGRDHPSWLGDHLLAAVEGAARSGSRPTVLLLGADAPDVPGIDEVADFRRFGRLSDEDLSGKLAAADVFVVPLIDGVSTRRTTLMAALQHGLVVVGTEGPLTDPELRQAQDALRLVPVGDLPALAEEMHRLAADAELRVALGRAARELYERSFGWPVITTRLLEALA